MSESEHTLKNSRRYWLLDASIPDIPYPSAQLIRQINMSFSIPFGYTGVALLSPEGQAFANSLREMAGRCLGGGVLASRDLEWLANGKKGTKPGDYVPTKSLFGSSKEPQSVLPSEWIAFEYGLLLTAPFGSPLVSSWDDVLSVAKVRTQGRDIHIRIDGYFGEPGETIFAQANQNGITALMKICELAGVPVYR
jgi:hypothetical protein